jgi:hypothetical protein
VRVEYIGPDYADDAEPAATGGRVAYADQVAGGLVRGPTFVPAQLPAVKTPAPVDAPAWLTERQPLAVDAVWTPVDGAQERTSAMDRAKALRVRLVPFLVTWGLIAGVVGVVVWQVAKQWPAGALLALLLFATLTAVTYYRLNRTDYDYSREGTERHRLDTAADLARRQMNHEHELRRMALDTYLRTLERHEGGGR